MREHETTVMSPGYAASLIEARCLTCGWRGPEHDVHDRLGRVLADQDAQDHHATAT